MLQLELPELAPLTCPPIVEMRLDEVPVGLGLARDATTRPSNRKASHLRNGFSAILAVSQALALGEPAARNLDCVLDACINLFLHSPFGSPTACHGRT